MSWIWQVSEKRKWRCSAVSPMPILPIFKSLFSTLHQEDPGAFLHVRTDYTQEGSSTPCCNSPCFEHFQLEERMRDHGFRTLLGHLSFPAGFPIFPAVLKYHYYLVFFFFICFLLFLAINKASNQYSCTNRTNTKKQHW